jgi:AcrR family transcriptional regulator
MARTLNPESHALKRDAFIDVAQRLIQTKGYEALSVQDVLDALDASKGAFYHYFGSKADLLEAVVDRMADGVEAAWAGVMADPDLTGAERLDAVFSTTAQYKAERKDFVIAVLELWLSDQNAIVREKLRRLATRRMTPVLVQIVRKGVADGEFTANNPDSTAVVVAALIQGMSEVAGDLYLGAQSGSIGLAEVEAAFAAYTEGLERILGLPAGRLHPIEKSTLELWFTPLIPATPAATASKGTS